MILGILLGVYALTCLVAARVVYTKVMTDQWFTDFHGYDVGEAGVIMMSVLFWPAAIVAWGAYRFVTGGVKEK